MVVSNLLYSGTYVQNLVWLSDTQFHHPLLLRPILSNTMRWRDNQFFVEWGWFYNHQTTSAIKCNWSPWREFQRQAGKLAKRCSRSLSLIGRYRVRECKNKSAESRVEKWEKRVAEKAENPCWKKPNSASTNLRKWAERNRNLETCAMRARATNKLRHLQRKNHHRDAEKSYLCNKWSEKWCYFRDLEERAFKYVTFLNYKIVHSTRKLTS